MTVTSLIQIYGLFVPKEIYLKYITHLFDMKYGSEELPNRQQQLETQALEWIEDQDLRKDK